MPKRVNSSYLLMINKCFFWTYLNNFVWITSAIVLDAHDVCSYGGVL